MHTKSWLAFNPQTPLLEQLVRQADISLVVVKILAIADAAPSPFKLA